ncbi:MAG: hypothetical protein Q4G36_10095 [Paracoccus sp. (in: a-proteobacteria)]|nr:hypothetical protein [Paracoccus sp. (in: a-proteobacteria)]
MQIVERRFKTRRAVLHKAENPRPGVLRRSGKVSIRAASFLQSALDGQGAGA